MVSKRPPLERFPGSVIGSLTTFTGTPPTSTYEHLNAHFWVSRFTSFKRPPPDPRAILDTLQPRLITCWRIERVLRRLMPSPQIRRRYGGRTLKPLVFTVTAPKGRLCSRISKICPSTTVGSPLSGRITSVPPDDSIMDRISGRQISRQKSKIL